MRGIIYSKLELDKSPGFSHQDTVTILGNTKKPSYQEAKDKVELLCYKTKVHKLQYRVIITPQASQIELHLPPRADDCRLVRVPSGVG